MPPLFDPGFDLFPRGIDVEPSADLAQFVKCFAPTGNLLGRQRLIDRGLRSHDPGHRRTVPSENDFTAVLDLSHEVRKLFLSFRNADVLHTGILAGTGVSRQIATIGECYSAAVTVCAFRPTTFRRTNTNAGQANAAMVQAACWVFR